MTAFFLSQFPSYNTILFSSASLHQLCLQAFIPPQSWSSALDGTPDFEVSNPELYFAEPLPRFPDLYKRGADDLETAFHPNAAGDKERMRGNDYKVEGKHERCLDPIRVSKRKVARDEDDLDNHRRTKTIKTDDEGPMVVDVPVPRPRIGILEARHQRRQLAIQTRRCKRHEAVKSHLSHLRTCCPLGATSKRSLRNSFVFNRHTSTPHPPHETPAPGTSSHTPSPPFT